jgi:hypothetical protein
VLFHEHHREIGDPQRDTEDGFFIVVFVVPTAPLAPPPSSLRVPSDRAFVEDLPELRIPTPDPLCSAKN